MKQRAETLLLSRIDFITTINDRHKEIISTRIRKPVHVVRDGVFEDILKQTLCSRKVPHRASEVTLIFVGQINHNRLDPLFKILPAVVEEFPALQFQVLGQGPQRERYMSMVKASKLEKHVTFLGYVLHEHVFDFIAKADIAYSDDWSTNGFPMKLFDYMAMGKAIVAEGTESIKELLIDQANAFLYADEADLKEKILILAKDEELRKKLGNKAKEIMNHHTWEKRAQELISIYHNYLSQRGNA